MNYLRPLLLWCVAILMLASSNLSAGLSIDVDWKFVTRGPIIGSPALDSDIVYCGALDSTF